LTARTTNQAEIKKSIVLFVPHEGKGIRLDRFLVSKLSVNDGPSRAELQRWIGSGGVTVDGVVKKAADKLREGACVCVEPAEMPATQALAEAGIDFEVVYVDEAIVVVDKPPGLVVHPACGHWSGTLVNGLLARGVFDPSHGDSDRIRPGIVHRLDKGTSGLMVVARHGRAREHLEAQFASHSIEREYMAICMGSVTAATFDTLHGRHPQSRVKFSSKVTTGKRAITHVHPLESFASGEATLVACRLETGRTHQIRVHLADNQRPIVGDDLYGKVPKHPLLREVAESLGRPALHARLLGFVHPTTGSQVRFESSPPADFQAALARLRAVS
jgi:23S rRNA pseudouridine1911/1915/1917 synthase